MKAIFTFLLGFVCLSAVAQDPYLAQFNLTNAEYDSLIQVKYLNRWAHLKGKFGIFPYAAKTNFDEMEVAGSDWSLVESARQSKYPLAAITTLPGWTIYQDPDTLREDFLADRIQGYFVVSLPFRAGESVYILGRAGRKGCIMGLEADIEVPYSMMTD